MHDHDYGRVDYKHHMLKNERHHLLAIIAVVILLSIAPIPFRQPAVLGPYSAATNFALDLRGEPDMRPGTWGRAGAEIKKITFKPPEGYSVRILRVYGDFLAWPRGVVPQGTFSGVLMAIATTGPEGSVRMDWGADNTMAYVQHATAGEPIRLPFDFNTRAGGVLQGDNVLVVKSAVWLNDTGLTIHMEPTFTMVYQFERRKK